MVSKQELRSEETKKAILFGAGKLFAVRGFDAVTMREIAKEAGCSHTTIYIYFKDKEALLHQLSMPPLKDLKQQMDNISLQNELSPEEKLKGISREFIRFCLLNRNMYMIFLGAKASRVDEEQPKLEINRLRNELFGLLKRVLQEYLQLRQDDDSLLAYTRIFFFTMHGIVGTYIYSEESVETLMERLTTTFDEAIEVLLIGFKQKLKNRS